MTAFRCEFFLCFFLILGVFECIPVRLPRPFQHNLTIRCFSKTLVVCIILSLFSLVVNGPHRFHALELSKSEKNHRGTCWTFFALSNMHNP